MAQQIDAIDVKNSRRGLQNEALLRPKDAGAYLKDKYGVGSKSSLDKLRVTGGGPAFIKIGSKAVAYYPSVLDAWMAGQMSERASTCDRAGAK